MARKKKSPLAGDVIVVHDGLGALDKPNKNKLNLDGLKIVNSVDVDKCFENSEPQATRWDYYIGLQGKGALYVEVHKVNEDEIENIIEKAIWLRAKIEELGWPEVDGRPLFVAPTAGIALGAAQYLRRKLALHKITIVMKGDQILKELDP